MSRGGWRAAGLQALFGLSALRVLGQVIVGLFQPSWLPPWDQWQSGLLPYPVLLAVQILLIAVMWILVAHNTKRTGRLTIRSERLRRGLRVFVWAYAVAMGVRYILTQAWMDVPWWHDTIPVVFHLVLASFLGLLSASRVEGR